MNGEQEPNNVTIKRGTGFHLGGHASNTSAQVPQSPRPESREDAPAGTKPKLMAKILDKIISIAVFAIFFGIPLFFTGLTFQGVVFEKQIYFYFWLLLALVAWAAKSVITGEMKIRRTPLDIPIAAFLAVYILATIFSVDRWHSFFGFFGDPSRGLMNIIALVIAYYLIVSHFDAKRLKFILIALTASGLLFSIWMTLGILGVKFLPAKILEIAPLSLIGSVSGAGAFFSLMIPIFITVLFAVRVAEKMGKNMKTALTVALLVAVALDLFLLLSLYAFVPWIALLIGIGFFLIYILSRIVRPVETWTWLPMAVFVLVMAILMIGTVNIAKVKLPIEVSPAYNISWQIGKDAVKDKFILGSGPATYGYDFSLHKPQNFNENIFYNLRFYQGTGLLSEAVPTMGVLGGIALVLLILSFVGAAAYLLTTGREKNKLYSLGFTVSVLIVLIYAVTARVEGSVLLMGALLATAAIAALLRESESEENYLNLSLKASPKYALALAFVFMVVSAGVAFLFVFVGKAFVADVYAGQAVRQTQITEEGSIAKLVKAINLYNREGRYYTRAGQEFMVLANNELLKGEQDRNLDNLRKYLNNSIAFSVRGRDLMKNDSLAVETLAQVYENAGFYITDSLKLAEETYQRAQELEPHNPNYYLKLGQIKVSQAVASKDENEKKELTQEAKDLFQKSVDEKKNFAPGYYNLALVEEALGGIDGAIEKMGNAAALDRNNVTYLFNLGRLYQARGKDDDNKKAEELFKAVLGVNDKEINAHFSLGLLYEKTDKKNEAIDKYQKVIDLLPAGSKDARDRIEKMIANIKAGVENIPENLKTAPEETQKVGQ
jgi:tetratricopeptide (TPR) repeat protein